MSICEFLIGFTVRFILQHQVCYVLIHPASLLSLLLIRGRMNVALHCSLAVGLHMAGKQESQQALEEA